MLCVLVSYYSCFLPPPPPPFLMAVTSDLSDRPVINVFAFLGKEELVTLLFDVCPCWASWLVTLLAPPPLPPPPPPPPPPPSFFSDLSDRSFNVFALLWKEELVTLLFDVCPCWASWLVTLPGPPPPLLLFFRSF